MNAAVLHRERWESFEDVPSANEPMPRGVAFAPAPWLQDAARMQHLAMVDAYRRSGGLLSGDEVALLLREHASQPLSVIARWIVTRRVVSYVWQSQTLVPMFQFDRSDMSLRRGTSEVVDELADTFDDWELAAWFAEPNSWLHGAAPVEMIEVDQRAVQQAARADRFVARG
jgi:hypothetical protein